MPSPLEVGRVFLPVARTGAEAVRVSAMSVVWPVRGAVAGVDRVCRVTNLRACAAACRDGLGGALPETSIAPYPSWQKIWPERCLRLASFLLIPVWAIIMTTCSVNKTRRQTNCPYEN